MKSIIAILAFSQAVHGHWQWARVALNGEWQGPFQYVRNVTNPYSAEPLNPPGYRGNFDRGALWPTYARDLPNSVRCGRGNQDHAAETEVLKVNAGDQVELAHIVKAGDNPDDPYRVMAEDFIDCKEGRGVCWPDTKDFMSFIHPGPFSLYLSKVPEGQDVRSYDGSGEWTKIWTLGLAKPVRNETNHWIMSSSEQKPPRWSATIPKQTPAGQYLLRIDTVWGVYDYEAADAEYGWAQHYPGCVQIEVASDVSGSLPPGVRIPETFTRGSPGTVWSSEMQANQAVDADYVYPGGPLWDGETLQEDRPEPYDE